MPKKTIDSILGEIGITAQQIEQCKQEAAQSDSIFEQCSIEKKLLTAEQVAQAYARFLDVEYLETIAESMADPALLGRVTLKFLRDNIVIPIKKDGALCIVYASPYAYQAVDEVSLLLGGVAHQAISTPKVIIDTINRFYPIEGTKQMIEELEEEQALAEEEAVDFGAIEQADILGAATDAPVIKLVNHILYQAVKRNASDIHVEPFEKEVQIRYRIDGVLYPALTPPKRIQAALISRIKIMANLNIAEKRKPQDGRIPIKVADRSIDVRVSVLPVQYGERIVMRLLDKSRSFSALDKLGFSERDLKVIKHSIAEPNGIILVSGPTGSGKTSTLYSILTELNTPEVNIITVEDPVEYQMPGVAQVQVREKIGLTFAAALRSIVRQDPDIIMIGETRDQETAQISIQSALTGHLVLSTIHTNGAPATITRLLDMGIEPYLIASTIISITAQRLVRLLCPKCKAVYKPTAEMLSMLGLTEQTASKITFYKPVGCPDCGTSGYKGRCAIFEIMEMSAAIARLTMERADTSQLRKQAIADGMTLLLDDGIRRIKEGVTSIEEVLSVASAQNEPLT